MRTIANLLWKILKWALIALIFLIVLVFVIAKVPAVQNYILGHGINYFNSKSEGELQVGRLTMNLPFHVGLRDVSLKDPGGVEILSLTSLDVHIGWRYALTKTIRADKISLEGLYGNVHVDEEGTPNYQFVLDAFASSDSTSTPADTSAGSWDVSVGKVELHDIRARYVDSGTRDSIDLELGSLVVRMDEMSLTHQTFLADEIALKNTRGFLRLASSTDADTETAVDTSTAELPLTLGLGRLLLENNRFTYEEEGTANRYFATLGRLELETDEVDLAAMNFDIDRLELADVGIELTMEESPEDTTATETDIFLPMTVGLDALDFSNVSMKMSTPGKEEPEMDLGVAELRIRNLAANPDGYALRIDALRASYGDFDRLRSFEAEMKLDRDDAEIKDLKLRYGEAALDLDAGWAYPEIDAVMSGNLEGEIRIDLKDLTLHPGDVRHLKTVLALPDSILPVPGSPMHLRAELTSTGDLRNLQNLEFELGNTRLRAAGEASGGSAAPENYRLDRFHAEIERGDLLPFLALAGVDTAMVPPRASIKLSGYAGLAGTDLDGDIRTTYGDITLTAKGTPTKTQTLPLSVEIASPIFAFHRLSGGTDSLAADFLIAVEVEDLRDTIHLGADFDLRTEKLVMGSDELSGIHLKGRYKSDSLNAVLSVQDTFMVADINVSALLADTLIAQVDGRVEGMDFEGLGLAGNDLRGRFGISVDYRQSDRAQSVRLLVDDILFVRGEDRFDLTPLSGYVVLDDDSTYISITSPFADFSSTSNRSVEDLTLAIGNVLGSEKSFAGDTAVWWRADFISKDAETLRDLFLPELETFEPTTAKVRFHSGKERLDARLNFPRVKYSAFEIDSLVLETQVRDGGVESELRLKRAAMDSLSLENLTFKTFNVADSTRMLFEVGEEESARHYHVQASMKSQRGLERGFDIVMADTIVLNGKKWDVDPENAFRMDENGIELKHFAIHRNNRSMQFDKVREETSLRVIAERFPLKAISGLIGTEEELLTGELFGEFVVNRNGTFNGSGRIEDLGLSRADFGELSWKAEKLESLYRVDVQTSGKDLEFGLSGDVIPLSDEASELRLNFSLDKLELGALPGLLPSLVETGKGRMVGAFDIGGTTKAPALQGHIRLEDSELTLRGNGSTYRIGDERITIDPNEINLNGFTLRDSAGQSLVLSGGITHENFDDMRADLRISGKDFELIDLEKGVNDLIYGSLLTDLDIRVTGSVSGPDVDAGIRISPGTNLTFIVPESDYDQSFDESLVQWTDFRQPDSAATILTRDKSETTETVDFFANTVRVNGNLKLDPAAEFKVVIDTLAGDYLMIRGSGDLAMSYDRRGYIRMNGTYEVSEGFYQMTFYNLVKRKFSFMEGSRLTWNGLPTDADIDITAIYETRATVSNLLAAGGGMQESSAINAKLPFEVHMNIAGQLMDPELTFDIQLADEAKGALGGAVEGQLARLRRNESDMNKQVFALLVLNSFLGDAGSNDNFIAGQARNSASQILSQQLNRLSDQWITGVDLNFDLQSYGGAAGEGNTDLSVELAKTFADDRVIVRVGSTIALEDNTQGAQQSQEVMTNLVVEYKITPDGRYRFKVFRENNLEDIVVGRVTRTGAGVLFQRDFDRLDRMFRKDPEVDVPEEEEGDSPPDEGDESSEGEDQNENPEGETTTEE